MTPTIAIEFAGRHARTAPDARHRAVGTGHVGIGAVIHVEQAALGGLEENALPWCMGFAAAGASCRRHAGEFALHSRR